MHGRTHMPFHMVKTPKSKSRGVWMHLCKCITMHNSPVLVHSLPKNGLVGKLQWYPGVHHVKRNVVGLLFSKNILDSSLHWVMVENSLQVVTCPSVLEKFNVVIQKIMKMPPSRKTLSKGSCPSGVEHDEDLQNCLNPLYAHLSSTQLELNIDLKICTLSWWISSSSFNLYQSLPYNYLRWLK